VATQTIYKDIGVGDESTFGASIACDSDRFHIKSFDINKVVEKEVMDDTTTTMLGGERMVRIKNTVEGDMNAYLTPKTMHHFMELANGALGVSSALGITGVLMTYNQNTNGTMVSKSLNVDRNNSQETFNGVRASSIEFSGSDGLLEMTLSTIAKTQSNIGTSMQDLVGETTKSAAMADVAITVSQGTAYASPDTLEVSDWKVKYENGLEAAFLSGSRDLTRSDPGIPTVTGSLKIFHEGVSYVNLAHGCSDAYIRFDITWPTCAGLIAGVTPYTATINVPQAQLTSNVRSYEAAEMSVEDLEFEGVFNSGTSALWQVTQSLDNTV